MRPFDEAPFPFWRTVVLAFALAAPMPARAEGTTNGARPASGAARSAPGREFLETCSQGAAKYAARDFQGAIAQFQKAIEISPNLALGHYFLGEAQLAAGSLTEAEAAYNRASSLSGVEDAPLHAKVLFVLADLKERQKRWEEARGAWQAYLDWANAHEGSGFPPSAQSRQQVIETMLKQDKAYEIVRQRIAETKNGNVFTDLSKAPPAK